MYEKYFSLTAEPFRMSPSLRFGFQHQSYKKIKSHVQYALFKAEGIVLITGRPGTGKTSLVDEICHKLTKSRIAVTKIASTRLDTRELLEATLYALGVQNPAASQAAMLRQLESALVAVRTGGRLPVLIYDEAQTLSDEALEQIRMMTNLQHNAQPLLQIFLVGQNELRGRVMTPAFEQLHQRILTACQFETLTVEETRDYIHHRLKVVGWSGDPAWEDALFPIIHVNSQGVPRWINLICSRLMLHAMAEDSHHLDMADLNSVLDDLRAEGLLPSLNGVERDNAVRAAVQPLEIRSADT